MSIQHKDGAPMVEREREGNMQPDVVVTLSDELASVLGFQNTWYREIEEYTLESVANVDTLNVIYVFCDIIEHRTVSHTLYWCPSCNRKARCLCLQKVRQNTVPSCFKETLAIFTSRFGTIKQNGFVFAREK